jgi:hypothetical protein
VLDLPNVIRSDVSVENATKQIVSNMALEDATRKRDAAMAGLDPPDILSLSSFIRTGRDLVTRQYEPFVSFMQGHVLMFRRLNLRYYVETHKNLSQPEIIDLQTKRAILQRAIYNWSLAQGEYMPHIKWARAQHDFSFGKIHGRPPGSSLLYFSRTSPSPSADDDTPLSNVRVPTPSPRIPTSTSSTSSPPTAATSASANVEMNDLMDHEGAEWIKLWLPSDVPPEHRLQVCSQRAVQIETMLLDAELNDSLIALRKWRRAYCLVRSFYLGALAVNGVTSATRKRSEISHAAEKVDAARIRYQRAWASRDRLDPNGDWKTTFRELRRDDIRGPNPGDDTEDLRAASRRRDRRERDQGAGRYEQSWIWLTLNTADDPNDQLRVQWAKMTANAERWEEEHQLVPEEMRRTLASFQFEVSKPALLHDSRVNVGYRPRAGRI